MLYINRFPDSVFNNSYIQNDLLLTSNPKIICKEDRIISYAFIYFPLPLAAVVVVGFILLSFILNDLFISVR